MTGTDTTPLTRRRLFALGGTAVGAAGAAALSRPLLTTPGPPAAAAVPAPLPDSVAFEGVHQAGIATSPQAHLLLTAYDLAPGAGRTELVSLLRAWTEAGRDLAAGRQTKGDPSIGTGSGPAALTVTVGVGGALLDRLAVARPAALVDLPAFAGDELDPARSGGDLVLQLCADDPIVLAHADRVLRAAAGSTARPRWQDTGFHSTGARRDRRTSRNLMGQLDGTNNTGTGQDTVGGAVWVGPDGRASMAGGSYLVFRRIRMLLDQWEAVPVPRQEQIVGRHKHSGAPLGSAQETDHVDLHARRPDGALLIPADSHVRLSTPGPGEQMLRRGYSYRGGLLPDGTTDQGLLFLSYQCDPRTSFLPVQQRLADGDALSAFTRTTGSAVFAVLPGVTDGRDHLGRRLFG